jgi:amino acid permease
MATRWADFDGAKPAAQTPYVGMVDGVEDEGGEGEGGKGGGGGGGGEQKQTDREARRRASVRAQLEEGGEQKQTDREAYFNLCRGSLGPGMLALPHVFSLVGWSLGMLLLALLSAAIWLNMVLLVEVRHFLGRSTQQLRRAPAAAWFSPHRLGADVRTYPEIGRAVWGRAGHAAVECVLVALELGICTVYFVFLSTNLGIVLGDGAATVRGHRLLMAALFAPLAALTQLRFVRQLAPLSAFANLCMLGAIALVVVLSARQITTEGADPSFTALHTPLSQLPFFLATVVYSYEGCGALLPIENALAAPAHFRRIAARGFATFFGCYAVIGLLGYGAFALGAGSAIPVGDRGSISAVIKYAMPDSVAADVLNVAVVVAVALTFPLQFFSAAETLEKSLGWGGGGGGGGEEGDGGNLGGGGGWCSSPREVRRTCFRCFLCAVALALALSIPHLSIIIALLGAVCGGAIELVLPPALVLGSGMCSAADLPRSSVLGGLSVRSRQALMLAQLALGLGIMFSGAAQAIAELADAM